jgi:putative lipoprotein (rSAM/lipoprotein system)
MKIIKTLKKYTAHMLATGFTMTLAACYGPMDDSYGYSIKGKVTDSLQGTGIDGIEVCAVQQDYRVCEVTDASGNYQIIPNTNIRYDLYQVCAEDVDDATNGIYIKKCLDVDSYDEGPVVDIRLDSTNLKDNYEK